MAVGSRSLEVEPNIQDMDLAVVAAFDRKVDMAAAAAIAGSVTPDNFDYTVDGRVVNNFY